MGFEHCLELLTREGPGYFKGGGHTTWLFHAPPEGMTLGGKPGVRWGIEHLWRVAAPL